ncbi:hypothetical protein VNO80_27107 [Phaseolus coccineus]|uniref:Uncharacterized protein n=1 Tax=Phaseolus coccineus TaxID=3886 RepID=A0AAN9QL30_PHACN
MHALVVGLQLGKFLNTLYVEPREDMDQLQVRAVKYLSMEENVNARRKTMKALAAITFTSYKRNRPWKFENYTPVNALRKINLGHNIEECFRVKDLLEELIRLEALERSRARTTHREMGESQRQPENNDGPRVSICCKEIGGISNFYPLSDGPSTRHRRITKAGSCSQAPFCLCTRGPISVWPEETFARLRYLWGGLRPIETVGIDPNFCLSQTLHPTPGETSITLDLPLLLLMLEALCSG